MEPTKGVKNYIDFISKITDKNKRERAIKMFDDVISRNFDKLVDSVIESYENREDEIKNYYNERELKMKNDYEKIINFLALELEKKEEIIKDLENSMKSK